MDAGSAEALHAEQHDLQPRRLARIGPADIAAAVAVEDAGALARPLAGERLDRPLGNTAFFARPRRCFFHAVGASHHIVGEFIEAVGVLFDVILVISPLRQPDPSNGELERRVRVWQDGNPLVRMDRRGVIERRVDENAFDADGAEEKAQVAGQEARDAERRHLAVAAPVEHGVGVFADIRIEVRAGVHLAERLAAPDMARAEVPALPRVHVAHLYRVGSDEPDKAVRAALVGDMLALAVTVGLDEHGAHPVSIAHAQQLVGGDLRRLVPADADVFGNAAVLRIALALRVPVRALEGIGHAVFGVNARFIGQPEGGNGRTLRRLERPAAGGDGPLILRDVARMVFRVIKGTDAENAPAPHLHTAGISRIPDAREAGAFYHLFSRGQRSLHVLFLLLFSRLKPCFRR